MVHLYYYCRPYDTVKPIGDRLREEPLFSLATVRLLDTLALFQQLIVQLSVSPILCCAAYLIQVSQSL